MTVKVFFPEMLPSDDGMLGLHAKGTRTDDRLDIVSLVEADEADWINVVVRFQYGDVLVTVDDVIETVRFVSADPRPVPGGQSVIRLVLDIV